MMMRILSILKWPAILVVLAVLWIALLWFGVTPDWHRWSTSGVIGLHALPPLGLASGAWLFGFARENKRSAAKKTQEEQQKQEEEQAQRVAEQERLAEQVRRRFAAPVVAVAQGEATMNALKPAQEDTAATPGFPIYWQPVRDAMADVFAQLYRQTESAASLPILVHTTEFAAADLLSRLLTDSRLAAAELIGASPAKLSFTTAGEEQTLVEQGLDRLRTDKTLPGIVLLSCSGKQEEGQVQGQVSAILLASPALKGQQLQTHLSPEEFDLFETLPPLAILHRPDTDLDASLHNANVPTYDRKKAPQPLAGLVHNAGSGDLGRSRLIDIAQPLSQKFPKFNPINSGTDVAKIAPTSVLATLVQASHQYKGVTLCSAYDKSDSLIHTVFTQA